MVLSICFIFVPSLFSTEPWPTEFPDWLSEFLNWSLGIKSYPLSYSLPPDGSFWTISPLGLGDPVHHPPISFLQTHLSSFSTLSLPETHFLITSLGWVLTYFHSTTWLDVIFRHKQLSSTLCLSVELVLTDSANEVYVKTYSKEKKSQSMWNFFLFFIKIN